MIYKKPIAQKALGIFKEVIAFLQVFVVVAAMISGAAILLRNFMGLTI